MTDNRIWVLGAPDPEMTLIEGLLRECGEECIYALDERGGRVHPGSAYRCPAPYVPEGSTVYAVECIDVLPEAWVRIDHHRPGDPGYGRPPAEFFAAASIGQVIAELARLGALSDPPDDFAAESPSVQPARLHEAGDMARMYVASEPDQVWVVRAVDEDEDLVWRSIPQGIVLTAAADHCLAAAYRGECPGVDPDTLMRWRAETRAKFQRRSVDDVLADVDLARRALQEAQIVPCDFNVEGWCDGCGPNCMFCPRCGTFECGANLECPPDYYMCVGVLDLRHAYTITTTLVAPFAEGATVDSAGVGDSREVVFGDRDEGAWDEGGHHTFVRRGVPELPEAAAREGVAYLATVSDRDGRTKVVLGGAASPEMVREFMEQWAPAEGLVDIYGDPARGFAGGYLSEVAK